MTPRDSMFPHTNHGVEKGFPPTPESASAARRFVLDAAQADNEDDRTRLTTLVSELATNAILHARTPFKVKVLRDQLHIRVSVTDESATPPMRKAFLSNQPTGRGLVILDSLADRWGVAIENGGKTVWFEIEEGR